MSRILELKGISKAFGGLQVIDGLDLHVDEGEIVSVIGPNGAGKTTLFNLITGVYQPDRGDILLEGESLLGLLHPRSTSPIAATSCSRASRSSACSRTRSRSAVSPARSRRCACS